MRFSILIFETAFGQVFLGWLVIDNADGTTKRERVAIKALTTGRSTAQIKNRDDAILLNKEIQTMRRCVYKKNVFLKSYGELSVFFGFWIKP